MANRCQSCGMPLSKDSQGGGTEQDGSLSTKYCSICYVDGAFVHPCDDAKEFQAKCVDGMSENGMPRILAWLLTRGIPRLERWQQR